MSLNNIVVKKPPGCSQTYDFFEVIHGSQLIDSMILTPNDRQAVVSNRIKSRLVVGITSIHTIPVICILFVAHIESIRNRV